MMKIVIYYLRKIYCLALKTIRLNLTNWNFLLFDGVEEYLLVA